MLHLEALRALRRNNIGSVADLPVFPPSRVYGRDRRPWNRITAADDDIVMCHNDLSPHNILVDPTDDSFPITAIIDWEYAGFFPAEFELPLWQCPERNERHDMMRAYTARDLAFFGLTPADMKDCVEDMPSWLDAAV
ncbi:hypothetical protein LOY91_004520 [Ophidiomyces ophidiicola]|nr:hypothetical protein LOY91_004520 [Ophidiomyces ophidiicola]